MEPVTVWRVLLRRGDVREREGTLRLEAEALVFEENDAADETRMAFSSIRSAKRVRGSPIMIVVHEEAGERAETAFYFSKPPPLETEPLGGRSTSPTGRPIGPFAAMRRTSKRHHQRENLRYLTARSGGWKQTIQAWVDEIGWRAGR